MFRASVSEFMGGFGALLDAVEEFGGELDFAVLAVTVAVFLGVGAGVGVDVAFDDEAALLVVGAAFLFKHGAVLGKPGLAQEVAVRSGNNEAIERPADPRHEFGFPVEKHVQDVAVGVVDIFRDCGAGNGIPGIIHCHFKINASGGVRAGSLYAIGHLSVLYDEVRRHLRIVKSVKVDFGLGCQKRGT